MLETQIARNKQILYSYVAGKKHPKHFGKFLENDFLHANNTKGRKWFNQNIICFFSNQNKLGLTMVFWVFKRRLARHLAA